MNVLFVVRLLEGPTEVARRAGVLRRPGVDEVIALKGERERIGGRGMLEVAVEVKDAVWR